MPPHVPITHDLGASCLKCGRRRLAPRVAWRPGGDPADPSRRGSRSPLVPVMVNTARHGPRISSRPPRSSTKPIGRTGIRTPPHPSTVLWSDPLCHGPIHRVMVREGGPPTTFSAKASNAWIVGPRRLWHRTRSFWCRLSLTRIDMARQRINPWRPSRHRRRLSTCPN